MRLINAIFYAIWLGFAGVIVAIFATVLDLVRENPLLPLLRAFCCLLWQPFRACIWIVRQFRP
jgi:hypothetical protein